MALFFFEFDVTVGPQLVKSITQREYSEEEMSSLRFSAFPETLGPPPKSLFFTYKVSKEFCYCLYITRADPEKPRGHVQNSLVIATEAPYFTPFMHFLLSAASIDAGDASVVFDLVSEFLKKWIDKLPSVPRESMDIPMLVGSLPVTCPASERDVLNDGATYILNECFADIDLCQTLEVQKLLKQGTTGDILSLWEAAVSDESVLVMGRNAGMVSGAVLTIASLAYPQKPIETMFPYISATDPRFARLMMGRALVGVVNPIGAEYASNFKHVFNVGFEEIGLAQSRGTWRFLTGFNHITSKIIRRQLYTNTMKVIACIKQCFTSHCPIDPYGSCAGCLDAAELADAFTEAGVETMRSAYDFASAVLKGSLCIQTCRQCTADPAMISVIRRFSVCRLCSQLNDDDKVQLYSNIQDFKKYCVQTREMLELVDNHGQAVKLALCPDLVFT